MHAVAGDDVVRAGIHPLGAVELDPAGVASGGERAVVVDLVAGDGQMVGGRLDAAHPVTVDMVAGDLRAGARFEAVTGTRSYPEVTDQQVPTPREDVAG